MVVFPNAKINIGLHITGKRNDGYHNIESCFYPVGWSDILEVVESEHLSLESSGIPIPGAPEDNLCIKAYHLLKKEHRIPPVVFHLHKILPIGAGLGGGSSDGTYALKAMNELFGLKRNDRQLEEIAIKMGSDCPFFVKNKPAFISGRGELLGEIDLSLKGKFILMVNPSVHVSTAGAYSGIMNYSKEGILKETLEKTPLENWQGIIKNDFEESVFKNHPEIALIKKRLLDKGALYASMSGSGATVYGIFHDKVNAGNWFPSDHLMWQGLL